MDGARGTGGTHGRPRSRIHTQRRAEANVTAHELAGPVAGQGWGRQPGPRQVRGFTQVKGAGPRGMLVADPDARRHWLPLRKGRFLWGKSAQHFPKPATVLCPGGPYRTLQAVRLRAFAQDVPLVAGMHAVNCSSFTHYTRPQVHPSCPEPWTDPSPGSPGSPQSTALACRAAQRLAKRCSRAVTARRRASQLLRGPPSCHTRVPGTRGLLLRIPCREKQL